MNLKDKVFLQLFNKRKLGNGNKTFLELKIFSFVVRFKKFGFSVSLNALSKDTTSEPAGLSPH